MKKYEILCASDFHGFHKKIIDYINHNEKNGLPFKKINIVVKSWRKDKTPQQHKYYWMIIGHMVKAFKGVGYQFTPEEVHEFIKKENGFTETIILKNGRTIHKTKSISDNSESVNTKVMIDLIEYCIQFAAENLDYIIPSSEGGK